jgi:ubiquinone/menaquinone biosynthesis C-methylase UbiE
MAGFGSAASVPSVTDRRGLVFDRVADEYDRIRSSYPPELVDEACSLAGLRPGSHVLEIGCGTGKLTRLLVERELRVDAVDPGPAMVEIARRSVSPQSVSFHVGRFEEIALPPRSFDAAFSATAFHWVDPAIGWRKVAGLLRPGGVLALIAHVGGGTEIDREFLAAWREVVPEAARWETRDAATLREGAEARRANVSEVWGWLTQHELARPEAASLFEDVRITGVAVEQEQSLEAALALTRTTSRYLELEDDRRLRLEQRLTDAIMRAGGTIRSKGQATLVTARASR